MLFRQPLEDQDNSFSNSLEFNSSFFNKGMSKINLSNNNNQNILFNKGQRMRKEDNPIKEDD